MSHPHEQRFRTRIKKIRLFRTNHRNLCTRSDTVHTYRFKIVVKTTMKFSYLLLVLDQKLNQQYFYHSIFPTSHSLFVNQNSKSFYAIIHRIFSTPIEHAKNYRLVFIPTIQFFYETVNHSFISQFFYYNSQFLH